jgi:hypothetical protein
MPKKPTVVVTVNFKKQQVTGEQIAALVQQVVAKNEEGDLIVDRSYHDGDVIIVGQTSGYGHNHIRVVPSLNVEFLDLVKRYSEVKVTSHFWGGGVLAVDYGQDSVVDAVKEFAADLTTAYEAALKNGFPKYIPPEGPEYSWE